MDPEASSGPAQAGIHGQVSVIVAEPAWRRLVPRAEAVAARAARAAGAAAAAVVLAADRTVRRLNARHRGRNKPTNVLTYASPGAGDRAGARRDPARGRGGRAPPGASPGASGGAWRRCILPATTTTTPARRAAWSWPRPASCTGWACPTRGSAHERERQRRARTSLLRRLRQLLGRRQPEHSLRESIAELVQEAADAQQEAGEQPELDRQERALIANILRLRETTADDVMVPRADIVAMRVDVTLEQALEQIRTEGHSRLPVYREQLDDIVGMVHIKDVFAYVGRPEAFRLEAILRRPLMVAPQMPVLDLLLQMRQQRMHLALVIDEYGGVDGLVTIEDLVETIVGDISDEHDEVQAAMVVERADGTLDVNARLPVEEFESRMGPVLSRGRARRRHRDGGRAGVHAGRAGAGEGRGDQPSVGDRVPRAGRRSAADPAAAGAAGGGADGGGGGVRAEVS